MEYKKEKTIQQKNNDNKKAGKNTVQLKDNRSLKSIFSKKTAQLINLEEANQIQLKNISSSNKIVQRGKDDEKKKKTGKKGETYGDIGSGYSQEDLEEARRRTGGISAHGSRKSGAGISGKTKKESRLFTTELRSIKAEKKETKRKAKITGHKKYDPSSKQAGKMLDFEKAAKRARELSSTADQEEFDRYLKARGYDFTEQELDELYEILYGDLIDVDEFQDDKKPDKDDEKDHDRFGGGGGGSLIAT